MDLNDAYLTGGIARGLFGKSPISLETYGEEVTNHPTAAEASKRQAVEEM